jgi:tartrate/fumarate subfamily iron-sulfur-dependent hydro-lyase beta chain
MERMMVHTIKELQAPLSLATVQELKIGDLVTLNGIFFSCRSKFHAKMIREKAPIPQSLSGINVMCQMGPIMKMEQGKWGVVSAGPTTSFRMDPYGPAIIRKLGLRAIIGKGTMGEETTAAMRDAGCVHLCSIGMNANILPGAIRRVLSVEYLEEFGMIEAVWIFEAKGWGPFMVDIDTTGENYFHHFKNEVRRRLPGILKQLGVDPEYRYAIF